VSIKPACLVPNFLLHVRVMVCFKCVHKRLRRIVRLHRLPIFRLHFPCVLMLTLLVDYHNAGGP
jgi:hypothetical protein